MRALAIGEVRHCGGSDPQYAAQSLYAPSGAHRTARGEAHTKIKKLEKIAEDDRTRGEKELQKFTDDHIKQIDQLVTAKEAEIMEV